MATMANGWVSPVPEVSLNLHEQLSNRSSFGLSLHLQQKVNSWVGPYFNKNGFRHNKKGQCGQIILAHLSLRQAFP